MITTIIFASSLTVLAYIEQESAQRPLPPDLVRVVLADKGAEDIVRLFRQNENSRLFAGSTILAETREFSDRMARQCVRVPSAITLDWKGYVTPNRLSEVMAATWVSELGVCTWVDNGRFASLRCELGIRENLDEVDLALRFVEAEVPQLLNAPVISREKFQHWLKPLQGTPAMWVGMVNRDVKVEEETFSDGTKLLRILEKPTWHQRLEIATDGSTITIYFELPEKQKSPNGPSARPNTYRPFRFHDSA